MDSVFEEPLPGDDNSAGTTSESIAQKIRTAIIDGSLVPGHKLGEVDIASRMRTSRTPVREAFRVLQSEGYLEHIPRCGVVVAGLRRDEVSDLWELRSIREQAPAAAAARNISSDQFALLKDTQQQMEELAPFDPHEYTRLDTIVHAVVARASGNAKLEEQITRLWRMGSLGRTRSTFWKERALASCNEHKDMIRAIEMGDSVLARRFTEIHFTNSLRSILKILHSFPDS